MAHVVLILALFLQGSAWRALASSGQKPQRMAEFDAASDVDVACDARPAPVGRLKSTEPIPDRICANGLLQVSTKSREKVVAKDWGAEEGTDNGVSAAGMLHVSTKSRHQNELQFPGKSFFKEKVRKVIDTVSDIRSHVGDAWNSLPSVGKEVLMEHWHHVKNLDFDSDKLLEDVKTALGPVWDDLKDDVKKVIAEHWGTEEESDIGTGPVDLLQISTKAGHENELQFPGKSWLKEKVRKVIDTVSDIKNHVGDAWNSLPSVGKEVLTEHWHHVKNLNFDSDKLLEDVKTALGPIWDDLKDDVKKVIAEHWGTEKESDMGVASDCDCILGD